MRKLEKVAAVAVLAAAGFLTHEVAVAQVWIQNPLGVPLAPGCPAGYSWTKGNVRYECRTPPPSCQFGFAAGPVWNGTAWSYSCNAPPPPPTTPDPGQIGNGNSAPDLLMKVDTDCDGVVGGDQENAGRGSGWANVYRHTNPDGSFSYYQTAGTKIIPVSIAPGTKLRRDGTNGTCGHNGT